MASARNVTPSEPKTDGEETEECPTTRVEDYGGESLPDGRHGVIFNGWRVESVKNPILNSPELEQWDKELDAFRLPEMVFGKSSLELEHIPSGTVISFNAFDALKGWKAAKLPPVKVPAAAAWAAREKPSQEAILDYDYTYTTLYKGTLSSKMVHSGQRTEAAKPNLVSQQSHSLWQTSNTAEIDWNLLKRRDPILFFDEIILYEDELADSGIAQLSVRTRVMPQSWFVLLRFWLRVDAVLMRSYETRLFCPFGKNVVTSLGVSSEGSIINKQQVVREYCQREDTFDALAAKGYPSDSSEYKQPDTAVQRLTTRLTEKSVLDLGYPGV